MEPERYDQHENAGRGLSLASVVVLCVGLAIGLDRCGAALVGSFAAFVVGLSLCAFPMILCSRPHRLCWVGIGLSVVLFVMMTATALNLLKDLDKD